jgi:Zn finger protein HypA/HybF involved in hydrogenase expression
MAKGYFTQQIELLDSPHERVIQKLAIAAGREIDLSYHRPIPAYIRHSTKVICLECSREFRTQSMVPSCPGCGGSDVEVQ